MLRSKLEHWRIDSCLNFDRIMCTFIKTTAQIGKLFWNNRQQRMHSNETLTIVSVTIAYIFFNVVYIILLVTNEKNAFLSQSQILNQISLRSYQVPDSLRL